MYRTHFDTVYMNTEGLKPKPIISSIHAFEKTRFKSLTNSNKSQLKCI